MGEFPPGAAVALKAAEEACGPVTLTEISDRRGSAVWKATGPRGAVSVKIGTGEAVEVTVREAAVLDELPGYSVISGRFGGGVWFVTPWLEGPSTWEAFRPVRKSEGGRARALEAAAGLCRAVGRLHADGWVHGDLQPQHGVHTEHGVRLLDFAWARRTGTTPWPSFTGTMVHLTAPELAARIVADQQPVLTTRAADVYALAGTLWTCVTGHWPLDYPAAGIDRRTLGPADLLTAVAGRSAPLTATIRWPETQAVLRPVLLAAADDRPTADELADLIGALSG
jgi:serine/threonine protein kinase